VLLIAHLRAAIGSRSLLLEERCKRPFRGLARRQRDADHEDERDEDTGMTGSVTTAVMDSGTTEQMFVPICQNRTVKKPPTMPATPPNVFARFQCKPNTSGMKNMPPIIDACRTTMSWTSPPSSPLLSARMNGMTPSTNTAIRLAQSFWRSVASVLMSLP